MSDAKEIAKVLGMLRKRFLNPGAMELGSPFHTLVAVMLSARTRDEQVLKLLPGFFHAFPSPAVLANADVHAIEARVNTIGMYRQKSRLVKAMAAQLVAQFGGKVPRTMDALVSLPGVGRKTASVVLVACFGASAIAVDTHVHRVTNRLGWVKTNTPEKTEAALLPVVPEQLQPTVNRVFVKLGRYVCLPGKPRCWMCPIRAHCAFAKKNLLPPNDAAEIQADVERRERELERLRERALKS